MRKFGGYQVWATCDQVSVVLSCLESVLSNISCTRGLESSKALKLLPAPVDDSSRKHILGVTSARILLEFFF